MMMMMIMMMMKIVNIYHIFIPKARKYFSPALVCVCLSVTTITKKIVDVFVPNFMGRFIGKGKTKFVFRYTIGRWIWK